MYKDLFSSVFRDGFLRRFSPFKNRINRFPIKFWWANSVILQILQERFRGILGILDLAGKNPNPGDLGFFRILPSGFFGRKNQIPSQSHLWIYLIRFIENQRNFDQIRFTEIWKISISGNFLHESQLISRKFGKALSPEIFNTNRARKIKVTVFWERHAALCELAHSGKTQLSLEIIL